MTAISERISETESRLAALRAKRGAAALDGADFDAAEYSNTEHELAALRDAEGEQVRRERQAAGQARKARKAELKGIIADREKQRIAAIADAEEYARGLVDALKRHRSITAELAAAVHELTGGVPGPLQSIGSENRLGMRLAAILATVGPTRAAASRYGHIEWPHSMNKHNDSWTVEESRLLKSHLDPLKEK